MTRRTPALTALALAAALALGACSSGGSDAESTTTAAKATTTTEAAPAKLQVLVSNDDGYDAPGLDALVEALRDDPTIEVTVVAPLTQQSGTGGKTTDGEVAISDVTTKSGFEAKAVDGYPSDAVRVAFDELGVEPDLVITGINSIQNIGPAIDESGTVGAAREGARHDVPALATSQGQGETIDYPSAIPFILDWIEEHRADLASGDAPVEVTNLNIPSCDTGEIRGQLEVPPSETTDLGAALTTQNCESTEPTENLTDDVTAFRNGYVTIGVIPNEPGS